MLNKYRIFSLILILFVLLAGLSSTGLAGVQDVIPVNQIEAGMKGKGRSVFLGDTIEEFDVEVLGVMRNIQPKKDLIVVRISGANIEGVRILDSRLHTRKLKRGTLDGNRFELVIRHFDGDLTHTEQRLVQIQSNGVPNYFGPQRFGRNGLNVDRGYKLLSTNTRLPRNKRSIYLSAMRSFLFNEVLAERVRNGSWNNIMDGELVMLNGTHSIFECEKVDADIEDRCQRLDIHPTGPLPGEGGSKPSAGAAVFEQAVLQNFEVLSDVLKAQRV